MDSKQFREHGMKMVDYICNYNANISDRNVSPTLDPGYLRKLLPGMCLVMIMLVERMC